MIRDLANRAALILWWTRIAVIVIMNFVTLAHGLLQ